MAEIKTKRIKLQKKMGKRWFFANLSYWFLGAHWLESTLIYRGWKRNILSLLRTNLGIWFEPEWSQPLAQSDHHELSNLTVKGCLSWPFWAGTMVAVVSIGQKGPYRGVVKCQILFHISHWSYISLI